MTDTPTLKSCPFCDGKPVLDGKSDYLRIRCESCGTEGPVFGFEDYDIDHSLAVHAERFARDHWNHRPLTEAEG